MTGVNEQSRADEDGTDQIGYDTPRSGVATPQPDLTDKRLPGIMSFFGQVGSTSLNSLFRSFPSTRAPETELSCPTPPQEEKEADTLPQQLPGPDAVSLSKDSTTEGLPLLPHERITPPTEAEPSQHTTPQLNPYPTPPCSHPPSERGLKLSDASGDGVEPAAGDVVGSVPSSKHRKSISDLAQMKSRRASVASPLSSIVTASSVLASHLSNPTGRTASTTPSSPSGTHSPSGDVFSKSASIDRLKKLTHVGTQKSGPPTPTRALSAGQPSQVEPKSSTASVSSPSKNGDTFEGTSGRQIPVASQTGGAQAPVQRGKLTIKILEARGLRKSRDPYCVAVFQRSELISPGPRTFEDDDELNLPPVPMGGIPIQRQGSDAGRPMAIPMRSRQSSNTSITDYTTFRNRTRKSFTSPKWDAEAVFDVVDSDMLVDISVYDHGANGEFLGHVDFQAIIPGKDDPVRGWYPLQGHADTMAENAPTGEIYVEAIYQRTEKRHYGPDDFQILRLIGKGTFGQVYQVRKKDTGRIYAMKVLSKKVIVQKKEVAHTVGERNILVRTAMSESPFIVGLKFSFQTQNDLFLVTDYMSGGELFWHLQKEGRFDEKRAKFYIAELILAIQHLHHNDIVYRDLKPENILLDANGHIALCDFGLSKANLTKNDTTNTFCGTTEYLAPEVLLDEAGYTKMVDFWSLGVLVFEMCCGWSPFYAEDTQQMYKNIAFGKVRFPRDTLSQEGRNFVKGLLNRNPKHRLGAVDDAEELKRHPFFADIDWDILTKKLITPPFKPKLKSETDVSYFDPEFTNALNTNGSLNKRAQQLATGFTTSTPLSPTTQANFQGFTFVDESSLDDHMRGRYDDEEMDDRRDNDWDDLDDLDLRKANRMSGVVRTGQDEPFGESQFDM
ncbi:kinase-like domain-containing protein [Pseudomassariella vexata]|uniref:non-specific serine/threonine protein kinase n=1 Tax=Pseudomassariella vexata TaxID=1141098 RepID=A0A1Y2DEL2_9PEZI|nr:kinase-like domain-containing protein [Pseudomassariella vexata]ORY57534.1 kinase-like domain-containing protein [Pseudomassariella vexata]